MNIPFANFFFLFPLFTSFWTASMTKILMVDLVVAPDSTTYNWPYENTSVGVWRTRGRRVNLYLRV
jgi:hypothetical protein